MERGRETFLRSSGRRKALKGEARERCGLKEAYKGLEVKKRHIERVAKPEGVTPKEQGKSFLGAGVTSFGVRDGPLDLDMLRGSRAYARDSPKAGYGRRRTRVSGWL